MESTTKQNRLIEKAFRLVLTRVEGSREDRGRLVKGTTMLGAFRMVVKPEQSTNWQVGSIQKKK